MRNIRVVLERWGAWVVNNHEDVSWPLVAAGFNGLFADRLKSRPQCCDDDAMIISECMARLNRNNGDLHDLLVDYYVFGMSFMALSRKHGCSDTCIGKRLQKAEGVMEGMLLMMDVRLEMDTSIRC
ncbi:antitermination protein [Escherichia coli]|nr:antitermination protein [Escherichia coli]EHR9097596.1 antitermination protein [Escherichia coli]EIM2919100.1 antitermination protein [Escherichia coli]EIM2935061.1 antitermination protein [Escherichia coli]EIM2940868.1 antitermination protein [Escherichia coli]